MKTILENSESIILETCNSINRVGKSFDHAGSILKLEDWWRDDESG